MIPSKPAEPGLGQDTGVLFRDVKPSHEQKEPGAGKTSRQSIIVPVPHFVVMEPLIVSLDFLEFPPTHTCDGDNLSPRIRLKGLNASSIAIMVFNPFEKSCCSFTPWIIWNIPPASVIPAGIPREGIVTAPVTAVQGITDHGSSGYTGPCPPHGQMIRYQFKVYGLDSMLDLEPGSDKHELVSAMKGHVLQFGETVGICSR